MPYLARTATDPSADRATEAAVEVTFQTLNRYLGVAVGEHLGYLFTGLWTAFAGIALVQSELLNPAFGVAGIAIAPLFVLGAAEFVGPFEPARLEGQRRPRPDRLRRLVDLAARRRHRPSGRGMKSGSAKREPFGLGLRGLGLDRDLLDLAGEGEGGLVGV